MTEIKYNKEKIIWQDQQDVEEYVWNQAYDSFFPDGF